MQQSRTDIFIKWGRITLLITVSFELTAILIILIYKGATLDAVAKNEFRNDISDVIGFLFGAVAVLLFTSVMWLISRLKKKRDIVARGKDEESTISKEICKLWIILSVFSVTYLMRSMWDIFANPEFASFKGMLVDLIIGILCDCIPVMILMIYHHRNFREKDNGIK